MIYILKFRNFFLAIGTRSIIREKKAKRKRKKRKYKLTKIEWKTLKDDTMYAKQYDNKSLGIYIQTMKHKNWANSVIVKFIVY